MNINLTLFGQTIAFAIFVWFCMKFVWPPLTLAMQERQKKIAEGLDAAGRAERDLQLAQERAAQMLRETKEQAAEILDRANKTANAIVEEAKAQARSEGEKLIVGAKAEIDLEVNRAKEQLRAQVAALAVTGAEKILRKEINASAHADMLVALKQDL